VETMDVKQVSRTWDMLNSAADALADAERLHEGTAGDCLLCRADAVSPHRPECLIGAIRENRLCVEDTIGRIEAAYPEICQLPLKPALS
jgi:hypothetical protein